MYGKSFREMVAKNGRFLAKTGGLESLPVPQIQLILSSFHECEYSVSELNTFKTMCLFQPVTIFLIF